MTEREGRPAGWEGYRKIGLVANPFDTSTGRQGESAGTRLAARAAALRVIGAIEEASSGERPRPVRVAKSSNLPNYYHVSASAVLLRELGEGTLTGILPIYVPLIMMREGRIRGTLSTLAEMVVGRSIDETIARYARNALESPDTALPEWEALSDMDTGALAGRFATEPVESVAEYFGTPETLREDVCSLDDIIKVGGMRRAGQDIDPSEDDDTTEADREDTAASLVEPAAEPTDEAAEEETAEEVDEGLVVVEYVVAHAREHLSPVVARALEAYVALGTAAMTEELKITRAPRKTLAAIATFASLTFDRIAIIYDRFEDWDGIPEETRLDIVSGLTEIKFALGNRGVIVIAGGDEPAYELDEQFATAIRVDWDFSELPAVQAEDAPLDLELIHAWLMSAALPGADLAALGSQIDEAIGDVDEIASAAPLAAGVVEKAASDSSSDGVVLA